MEMWVIGTKKVMEVWKMIETYFIEIGKRKNDVMKWMSLD